LLDSIEEETRTVLDKVKLNSPFMDALDDARAKVVTILRKHEREPQSAARDARIARLAVALQDLEQQYVEIQGVEKTMTRLLSEHALLRREIQLNEEVVAVENFVASLGKLTADLEAMTNVLAEVSKTTVDTSDTAVIAQD
jgi:vacuolar-type H+-ATPase subunit I/STV1